MSEPSNVSSSDFAQDEPLPARRSTTQHTKHTLGNIYSPSNQHIQEYLYNVYHAFVSADQLDRLNFLCMIAYQCRPLEARFLQLALHESIQASASTLSQSEELANNEAKLLGLIEARGLLSALHTIADLIPLLRSDNISAGQAISHILIQCKWHSSPRAPKDSKDFCRVCQAAFGMARTHPAIPKSNRDRLGKLLSEMLAGQQIDAVFSPSSESDANLATTQLSYEKSKKSINYAARTTNTYTKQPSQNLSNLQHREMLSATIIRVDNDYRKKDYSFVIDIVWKSGESTTCRRTHDEFFNFHVDLLEKFPEEAKKESRTIPALPGQHIAAQLSHSH